MKRVPLVAACALVFPMISFAQEQYVKQMMVALPQPASASCSAGIRLDDGTFESGYRIPFASGATFVQKFTPSSYPALLEQVCVCFTRNADAESSLSFSAVVYDDNGAVNTPGTFLGSVPASASGITFGGKFTDVNCIPLNLTVSSGSVFIGAQWNAAGILGRFICADQSASTPLATMYQSTNGAAPWNTLFGEFPQAKALGVRAEFQTSGSGCIPDDETLCIDDQPGDRRFMVEIDFETTQGGGLSGSGHAISLADKGIQRGGLFWFFGADNPELLIKVLNGCGINNHFWIFFSAGTNVGMTLTVTDTVTDRTFVRTNPDLTPVPTVQATNALPCS